MVDEGRNGGVVHRARHFIKFRPLLLNLAKEGLDPFRLFTGPQIIAQHVLQGGFRLGNDLINQFFDPLNIGFFIIIAKTIRVYFRLRHIAAKGIERLRDLDRMADQKGHVLVLIVGTVNGDTRKKEPYEAPHNNARPEGIFSVGTFPKCHIHLYPLSSCGLSPFTPTASSPLRFPARCIPSASQPDTMNAPLPGHPTRLECDKLSPKLSQKGATLGGYKIALF